MALCFVHFALVGVIITHLFTPSSSYEQSEFTIIWDDNMENINSWTRYNNFAFATTSSLCPNPDDKCCQTTVSGGNSYILRYTDVSSYSVLEFQIDINPYLNDASWCQIFYEYNNNGWIKFNDYTVSFTNLIINLPSSSTSDQVIGIKLAVDGNDGSSCYWDNAILRGILFRPSTTLSATDPNSNNSKAALIVIWILIVSICVCGCLSAVYIAYKKGYNCDDITRWFDKHKEESLKQKQSVHVRDESMDEFGTSLIASWLENEVHLPQYLHNFIDNGYDTLRGIKLISHKSGLIDIGISKLGHQILIMKAIQRLDTSIYEDVHTTNDIKVFVDGDDDIQNDDDSSSTPPSLFMANETEKGLGSDRVLDELIGGYKGTKGGPEYKETGGGIGISSFYVDDYDDDSSYSERKDDPFVSATFFDSMVGVTIMGDEKDAFSSYSSSVETASKVARIEEELISTEKTYLEGLCVLMYEFIEPIFSGKLIDDSYRRRVTCNIPSLISFHSQFLDSLSSGSISAVFNSQSDYFKMYIEYMNEYEIICDIFASSKRKNKKLQIYLDNKTSENKPLSNYLILPIQRIPRYMLLLSDLKKNTDCSTTAFRDIEYALNKVNEVCNEINEKKREIENISQCLKISETLRGLDQNIVEPQRKYVDHFIFKRKKDGKNRQFFVFSDIVIIANTKWDTKGLYKLTSFAVKRINHQIFTINTFHKNVPIAFIKTKDIPKKSAHKNVSNINRFCDIINEYRNHNALYSKKKNNHLIQENQNEEQLIHWETSSQQKGNKSKVLKMLGTPGGN